MGANPGFWRKIYLSLKFDAGSCGQVGCVWSWRDAEGLAEVWMQHQIQLLQVAWWKKTQIEKYTSPQAKRHLLSLL